MMTMQYGLTLPAMLERAEQFFPKKEIVSKEPAGIFRYTYREFGLTVRKLATALVALGVQKGDRVATLAWNQHRHLPWEPARRSPDGADAFTMAVGSLYPGEERLLAFIERCDRVHSPWLPRGLC